jgi:2-polyprenyl-6-methoxyphenol hydroxylase-like FAD-dependent oxidoreductase
MRSGIPMPVLEAEVAMTGRLDATVVGGGIAGLAAAIALAQAGWQTTVLERAAAFDELGAGLGVTPNGMIALAAIGVEHAVRAVGYQVYYGGLQDPAGRWLLRMPERADLRTATTFEGLHRRRLHAVLLTAAENAGSVELIPGAKVNSIRSGTPGGEPATVTWRAESGARSRESDLVVAADGVWSGVRAQLFPKARPRYAGSTSWRAVISDTDRDDRYVEAWGPGAAFGALRISDGEVYWWGDFLHPEGALIDDELAAARSRFDGWSPQVQATVAATAADQLIRNDVYHLPGGCPSYIHGRTVIIGDAAHAMVPNSGHGAATALEDGVCVGRMIAAAVTAGGDLTSALLDFDRARRPRCRQLARQGLMLARIGDGLKDGWRQPLRNALLRHVPVGVMIRAGTRAVRWTPLPANPAPALALD